MRADGEDDRSHRRCQRPPAEARTNFYVGVAAADRARAAWTWTRAQEGHRSFSDLIAHALAREVVRGEEKHNEGKPWPPLAAGEIGTGKPIGS